MDARDYIESLKGRKNKYSHLELYMYGITDKDSFDIFVNDLFDEIRSDINNQIEFRRENSYMAPIEKEYKELSDYSKHIADMAMMYKVLRGF